MRITQWLFKITSSTMANNKRGVIAVCQITSTNNKEKNFEICRDLAHRAKKLDVQMLFFPETCDYMGINKAETLSMAESLEGPTVKQYQKLAQETGLWLSFGGIHERISDEKVYNSHIIISSEGKLEGLYHKLHLFDVDWPEGGVYLKESSYCQGGGSIVPPVKTPVGNIGLSVDMRFPELSLRLRSLGADILTYPSAFTFATGAAHWETLLKARAIETQCYVVAAAQTGAHNPKRTSWGHAMVVDPWGSVVAQCSEGTNLAVAEIDFSYLDRVRKSMPVLQHRRSDVYSLKSVEKATASQTGDSVASYAFGQVTVPKECVFYETPHTIAFTNKKCVVPGHVLVAPIRCTERFSELSSIEVADLFSVVHRIQSTIEKVYSGSSSSVVIQDGPDAGQTIKHVHVHILPRRKGDFPENDDVYRELQKHDKASGGWRSVEEMSEEAESLRKHFQKC